MKASAMSQLQYQLMEATLQTIWDAKYRQMTPERHCRLQLRDMLYLKLFSHFRSRK